MPLHSTGEGTAYIKKETVEKTGVSVFNALSVLKGKKHVSIKLPPTRPNVVPDNTPNKDRSPIGKGETSVLLTSTINSFAGDNSM